MPSSTANEIITAASNYQTNLYPLGYSGLRTGRDTLEKLSIVRTLPNAPDVYIRFLVFGCMGFLIRRCHGPGDTGSQESRAPLQPQPHSCDDLASYHRGALTIA